VSTGQGKQIKPENLVFSGRGVLLGLAPHARSPQGSRVYELKPFYRGAKVSVIGAISLNKFMVTLDGSMDGNLLSFY